MDSEKRLGQAAPVLGAEPRGFVAVGACTVPAPRTRVPAHASDSETRISLATPKRCRQATRQPAPVGPPPFPRGVPPPPPPALLRAAPVSCAGPPARPPEPVCVSYHSRGPRGIPAAAAGAAIGGGGGTPAAAALGAAGDGAHGHVARPPVPQAGASLAPARVRSWQGRGRSAEGAEMEADRARRGIAKGRKGGAAGREAPRRIKVHITSDLAPTDVDVRKQDECTKIGNLPTLCCLQSVGVESRDGANEARTQQPSTARQRPPIFTRRISREGALGAIL